MRATFSKISKRAEWVLKCTSYVIAPNFLVYWLSMFYLHGDALNGYVKDGHYFLCWKGTYSEVSKAIWSYSHWHGISAYGGIMLLFAEAALFVTTKDIKLDFNQDAQQGR